MEVNDDFFGLLIEYVSITKGNDNLTTTSVNVKYNEQRFLVAW